MKNEKVQFETRDDILNLLTDGEVALVSKAETAERLLENEEYLDLDKLDQGVLKAGGRSINMGSVLPKKAVSAETWSSILARLNTPA